MQIAKNVKFLVLTLVISAQWNKIVNTLLKIRYKWLC